MRRPRPRAPLFLPRPDYRRRRLVDAARLLPVLGGFLVLLPILWVRADAPSGGTARDGIYLFVIWAVLVGAAALLANRLDDIADDDTVPEGDADTSDTGAAGSGGDA